MPVSVEKRLKKRVSVLEPRQSFLVDKEKYRQKRVSAYCRVSTDDKEQLTSYENQKKVYPQYPSEREILRRLHPPKDRNRGLHLKNPQEERG